MKNIIFLHLLSNDCLTHASSDNHIHPGDSGLYVSKITANGAAAKDGRLAVGDRIISVNGFDCKATTHADAVAAFKVMRVYGMVLFGMV